jgi:predicted PurR-regulated permease PerM
METRVRLPKVYFIAALVVLFWGLTEAKSFLIPISLAVLLAFMMAPVVRLLHRGRVPEWLAVVLSALLLVLPIVGVLYAVVNEGEALVRDWPRLSEAAQKSFVQLQNSSIVGRLHLHDSLEKMNSPENLTSRLGSEGGAGLKALAAGLRSVLAAGSHLVLIVFFAIVMLASRKNVRSSLDQFVAKERSPESADTLNEVSGLIERFLLARLGIVALVATVDFGILLGFGLTYSFLMAVFLGLMTLVPIVGFFVSVIPPILAAVTAGQTSPLLLFGLFASLGAVSSFQDHFLAPKWVGRQLNLNFLVTYLGIFAGERLWGAWGMFLAVPALGVLRIVLCADPSLKPWGLLLSERSRK